jgi:transcriptional regulator with XRE-family HTH domain
MRYALEDIGAALKAARERLGLSQRELADAAGTDQARISKIESGDIDLRLSSLVDLTRTLGIELVLADRRHLPAIEALLDDRVSDADPKRKARVIRRIGEHLQELLAEAAGDRQLTQAMNALGILAAARLTEAEHALLEEASAKLIGAKPETREGLRPALEALIRLRNAKAHGVPEASGQKPAYTLDDEDE